MACWAADDSNTVPGSGNRGGLSCSYRAWLTVNTGSKKDGWAWAAVIALLACCWVAPAATSALVRLAAFLILLPSTPIVTLLAWVVRAWPLAPRIAARAGQVSCSESLSLAPSLGVIVDGAQLTSHLPLTFFSRSVVFRLIVPSALSCSFSVTGSRA